jgi:hypothetical protein
MTDARLNQLIAVKKGVQSKAEKDITHLYQALAKPQLLTGISRSYTPKDDDGDKLPSESTLVQLKAEEVLRALEGSQTRYFDVVATLDTGNTEAVADVVVDGTTVLAAVPVSYLLFLEKRLTELHAFFSTIPTLDPSETWTYEPALGAYKTNPIGTTRTKKVPKNWVKAEATDKHPAQVDVYHEDVIVGYWETVKFSGALPVDERKKLLDRVDKLKAAVLFAREAANSKTVTDVSIGEALFGFLLAE